MRSLMEIGSRMSAAGDQALALKLLWAAATSGFWADRENELSEQIVVVAEGLPVDEDDPWLLAVLTYAAPIDRGGVVVDRVSRIAPDPTEPDAMWLLSAAAATVGAFNLAEVFAAASVAGLREQGRLGALAQALVLRAWSEIHIGRWDVAMPDAQEADRLAQETGQPIWGGGAKVALSILAGLRGEEDVAEALAVRAEQAGLQFGARAVLRSCSSRAVSRRLVPAARRRVCAAPAHVQSERSGLPSDGVLLGDRQPCRSRGSQRPPGRCP